MNANPSNLPARPGMAGGAHDPVEPVAMLTTEVAELTGKRHADVMRDTRNMLTKLGLGERSFASSYTSPQNKEVDCFRLPERELLVLLTGYSIPLRAKVIDRMRQLEAERRHANVVALPARGPLFGGLQEFKDTTEKR